MTNRMKSTCFLILLSLGFVESDVCTMAADRIIHNELNCYAVMTSPVTQTISEEKCHAAAGHVVFLESTAEQEWLHQELSNLGLPTTYWTGAHEIGDYLWYWTSNSINYFQVDLNRIYNYQISTGTSTALAVPGRLLEQSLQTNSHPYICEKDTTGIFVPPPNLAATTDVPLSVSQFAATTDVPLSVSQLVTTTDVPLSASQLVTTTEEPLSVSQLVTSTEEPLSVSQLVTSTEEPLSVSQLVTSTEEPLSVSQLVTTTEKPSSVQITPSASKCMKVFSKFVGISPNKAMTSPISTTSVTLCARQCLDIHCSIFCYFPLIHSCIRFLEDPTNGVDITCTSASTCFAA